MTTGVRSLLNCRQAEAELALQVSGDLDDGPRAELLAAHLAVCGHCRDYQLRLSQCLEVLQTCAAESAPSGRSAGVWQRVASALAAADVQPTLAHFHAWVPTTAIAAACAAMIFVTVVQVERGLPGAPQDYFSDPAFATRELPMHRITQPEMGRVDSTPVGFDLQRRDQPTRSPQRLRGEF